MKRYTKNDVRTHSDSGPERPAVRVKCDSFALGLDVAGEFSCDDATAKKALEYAWTSHCEQFWEQAQETAEFHLGKGVTIYSEGRSSGWLVVDGLPDLESWDAIQLTKWAKFERSILAEVAYLSSAEQVRDSITANEWAKPGAEQYNFIDRADGSTACIADLKAQAAEAGFSAVIRG